MWCFKYGLVIEKYVMKCVLMIYLIDYNELFIILKGYVE